MAFFELNSVPWDLGEGSVQEPDELIGGYVRSFSGQLRYRVRDRKRSFALRTAEYTRQEIDDLIDVLTSAAALIVTGDWFTGVFRVDTIGQEGPVPGDAGFFTLDFRLLEV